MDQDHSADCRGSAWEALLIGLWLCTACSDATVTVGKLGTTGGTRASLTEDAGGVRRNGSSGSSSADSFAPGAQADDAVYRVSIETGSRDDVCNGKGPALVSTHPGAAATDCAWRAERRIFSYGLCACEELRLDSDTFLLDSFDSDRGKYETSQTGGSIGVNGAIARLADNTQVLGNLISAGPAELALSGQKLFVAGDFKQQAALRLNAGGVRVARDLWLASDASASAGQGSLQVDGNAYQASGRTGLGTSNVTGRVHTGDFLVPEPCDCSVAPVIDVPALVSQAKITNDNAAVGFSPDALDLQMYVTDWNPLPCGRLYLTQLALQGLNTYVLVPIGRTAIFVQGDLRVGALSTLVMATDPVSGGELDVFVAGDVIIEANSSLVLGNNARPSATRLYVGGQMRITGNLALGGQLYAPQATLELSAAHAGVEQYGSILARKIRVPTRRMHYDRAILHVAAACGAPAPQTCDGCNQCPNDLACVAGSCGACKRDADCCDPSACSNGKCQALISNWP